jgi:hypothetical protein
LTEGFPSLKEMVELELKRRAEGEDHRPAFWFVACDESGALTDVDEAVAAIIDRTDNDPQGKVVYVSHLIERAVFDALHVAHPKRMPICNSIVAPGQSMRDLPRPDIELEPSRDHDDAGRAVDHAAKRIAQMREGA